MGSGYCRCYSCNSNNNLRKDIIMPMKKAKAGDKVANRGKYYGGGMMSKPKRKMMGGGMMQKKKKK